MNLKKIMNNIGELFKVSNQIFLYDNSLNKIVNLLNNKELTLEKPCRYWYNNGYLYLISLGEIIIYDCNYQIVKKNFDKKITPEGSALLFFDNNIYFLQNQYFDKSSRKLISQSTINFHDSLVEQENFYGKILSKNYRLNYPEERLSNPRTFRCSDLFDRKTFWEYDCGIGNQADRFYLYKESLLFVKGYDKHSVLVQIELKNGNIIYETKLGHSSFNFDESRGILISVWGNESQGKNYQIVDLNCQKVHYGPIVSNEAFDNVNVHWQQQFVNKNKLYFVDNVHSYGNNTVPIKFGCFDIVTKTVDFLQEIPTEYGIQISQIIYNEDKLYIRMTENTLLIYEDD